ncbi:MAG: SDR family NAD(P)-dependent oxidoreductase [Sphingomonadaceae bacterium]|nr:SDR family NAD(P)-dependent oxidoreductase [Sphingomonadaceae bacterium]
MQGRVVAVTGGCGVLGRAVIAELAARGAKPIAIDIATGGAPTEAADAFLGQDISAPAAAEALLGDIVAKHGTLDGVVNIAGGFVWQTVSEGAPESWERLYRLNVGTAYAMSRAAIPHLANSRGAIVNIGANGAVKAAAGMGAYAASKAGVHKLTESLAEELKDQGVRVNAVLPSIIDTPVNRKDMPDASFDRWVAPGSLAKVIAFLLSDDAEAITGALLPVTGRV